jgi:hypothetical protein
VVLRASVLPFYCHLASSDKELALPDARGSAPLATIDPAIREDQMSHANYISIGVSDSHPVHARMYQQLFAETETVQIRFFPCDFSNPVTPDLLIINAEQKEARIQAHVSDLLDAFPTLPVICFSPCGQILPELLKQHAGSVVSLTYEEVVSCLYDMTIESEALVKFLKEQDESPVGRCRVSTVFGAHRRTTCSIGRRLGNQPVG